MNMPSPTAGWFGTTASGGHAYTDVRGVPGPLPSPQYGPAWVADHLGTSHTDRVDAIIHSGRFDPELVDHLLVSNDRDQIARLYARLDAQS